VKDGTRSIRENGEEDFYMKIIDQNSPKAAYRRIIAQLVLALCAVPKKAREEWANELMEAGVETDSVPPDEFVIRRVLINLDVAESVADMHRQKMIRPAASRGASALKGLKPKLYPVVGKMATDQPVLRSGGLTVR
jgi:hypothetical protein